MLAAMKRLSFPGELGQGREPLWWMIGLALSLSAITGCEKDQPMDSPKGDDVSGTGTEASLNVEVFYRERMMLPPTATLEVVLEDSAKMDVAADRIANKTISVESGPPYRVTLAYDPSKLDPKGRFGVSARIEDQGKLIFISMEFVPAFGNDGSLGAPANDPVTVLVRRTRGSTEKSSTSVTGTRWSLQTLRGEPAGLGAEAQPEVVVAGLSGGLGEQAAELLEADFVDRAAQVVEADRGRAKDSINVAALRVDHFHHPGCGRGEYF